MSAHDLNVANYMQVNYVCSVDGFWRHLEHCQLLYSDPCLFPKLILYVASLHRSLNMPLEEELFDFASQYNGTNLTADDCSVINLHKNFINGTMSSLVHPMMRMTRELVDRTVAAAAFSAHANDTINRLTDEIASLRSNLTIGEVGGYEVNSLHVSFAVSYFLL